MVYIRLIIFYYFLLTSLNVVGQPFTIHGFVEDKSNGERLIGANVYDAISAAGTTTNEYGFYSLTVPFDSVHLVFSYVGYQGQIFDLQLKADTTLSIFLAPSISLDEVVVLAERVDRIEEKSQMSKIDLPITQIQQMPSLLGESDVLKALQLLPGVQSGGEGQNGLYIRGGSPDQNLILLDGVPVYNVSHLLGFFSVFNADAIKSVSLTKGGFPARYGGRLSSVIEISMKEGNKEHFEAEGAIGLVASRLTVQGPLLKKKASFMVSGRRTYIDLIARPIIKANQEPGFEYDPTLFFYDLNAKINFTILDRHRLYLSSYLGSDVFQFKSKETYSDGNTFRIDGGTDWGNITTSLRWNYLIHKKLFSNTTLIFSKYQFDYLSGTEDVYGDEIESFKAKYFSGIQDFGIRYRLDYLPNPDHSIRGGFDLTHHTYDPGAFQFETNIEDIRLDTIVGSQKSKSLEYAFFIEDDINMGKLKVNAGMHISAFDIEHSFYTSVQPRISARFLIGSGYAIKGSYAKMTQYINLLTNESLSLPTDLWVPSTDRILPQSSNQWALGLAKSFDDGFELSLEAYHKKMDHVLSYKEGVDFLGLEEDWQNKVTQGTGESYGVEFFIQKKRGNWTGWFGYTISWNNRTFGEINGGESFPYKYDRRHDISFFQNIDLSKKVKFNIAWVYGTGNSITLPIFRYQSPFRSFENFVLYEEIETVGKKNAFRMKSYHRLDLSFQFTKKKKKFERTWVVGFYNTYNRKNPYFIYSGRNESGERSFKQVSLFPVIPSISYQFKFS